MRSIPACAGESCPWWGRCGWPEVYPRVCGGIHPRVRQRRRRPGLSPRVRGNRALPNYEWGSLRSIPACAGESPIGMGCYHRGGVYPRVCGGILGYTAFTGGNPGLSPRVRGNPVGTGQAAPARRSIPACAGESLATSRWQPADGVYPRVCGGILWTNYTPPQDRGLSPRVRGNPPLGV